MDNVVGFPRHAVDAETRTRLRVVEENMTEALLAGVQLTKPSGRVEGLEGLAQRTTIKIAAIVWRELARYSRSNRRADRNSRT